MPKIEEYIHKSRMQQELLFQLLVHDKAFSKVSVGCLRDFALTATVKLNNYRAKFDCEKPEELCTDTDFNNFYPLLDKFLKEL